MIRVIGLGLLIVLAISVSSPAARDRKPVVKVLTWSGREVSGKLICRTRDYLEITDRDGLVRRFSSDTLDMAWKRGNATIPFAFMGALLGYVGGGIGSSNLKKEDARVRRFEGIMVGTLVFGFLGSEIPIWHKTAIFALPIIECSSAQSGGNPNLKVGLTLHF